MIFIIFFPLTIWSFKCMGIKMFSLDFFSLFCACVCWRRGGGAHRIFHIIRHSNRKKINKINKLLKLLRFFSPLKYYFSQFFLFQFITQVLFTLLNFKIIIFYKSDFFCFAFLKILDYLPAEYLSFKLNISFINPTDTNNIY